MGAYATTDAAFLQLDRYEQLPRKIKSKKCPWGRSWGTTVRILLFHTVRFVHVFTHVALGSWADEMDSLPPARK